MKRTLIVAFLLSAVAIGSAQTIQLGMSYEAVVQQFGKPLRYQLGDSTWPTRPTADEEAAFGTRQDVYSRRTSSNEYGVHIVYDDDLSESRLHPTMRVRAVKFVADKPEPLLTMANDVAEIRVICKDGCRIWLSPEIFVIVPSADRHYTGLAAFGSLRNATGERVRISPDWVVSEVGILTMREPVGQGKIKLLPGVYRP